MKTTLALSIILFLFFASCEKDNLVPSGEIPGWLKIQIALDEQSYKDNPKSMTAYGCIVAISVELIRIPGKSEDIA